MDLSISFRHVTPDESLKRYVEEKLARLQKYVPQKYLKLILGVIITFLAGSYIIQFFNR